MPTSSPYPLEKGQERDFLPASDPENVKEPIRTQHNKSLFTKRQFIITLFILIYGSGFLLQQINNFHKTFYNHPQQKYHSIIASVPQKEITDNAPLVTDEDSIGYPSKKPLTFEEVRKGTFLPQRKELQWIQTPSSLVNDSGEYVVVSKGKYLLKSQADKNSTIVLFEGDEITYDKRQFKIEDITFSDDLQYALIISNKIHNWRHSFFATYFVVSLKDGLVQPLYDLDFKSNEVIALAKWSPDSSKITFVLNNNVYLKDVTDFTHPTIKQVTQDGGPEVFYGKPDWVYEEEVFSSDSAIWWSPNSRYLAILRSNDTEVPVYPIPYFVQDALVNDSYPELRNIKYPKSGYPNPVVDIVIYDLEEGKLKSLPESDDFYNDEDIGNEERLITEVKWVGDQKFLIKITNRVSNLMKIFIIDSHDISSELSRFENGQNSKSWFEISHNTVYVPKSDTRPHDGYIDLIDVDGYDHIGYFSPPNAKEPVILTSGEWEVVGGASAFDLVLNKLYYISTEKSSIERHLFSVNLDGSDICF
ncbi:unnamed protein product [Ambrosiozyma monospora]|uniref:Unnamed protein product n=1 Tax=Ambrosiozyma monospora TaxID=43982 RepID=A0ACB5T951_AMBMO|nr:unnamed protein product [Ambrosiozyma monospora]